MSYKLYYAPGACSLSPHIALCAAELPYELVKVDIRQKTMADGGDFTAINPLGYVPVLEFSDGRRLTEGPAIVQYIADQVPDKRLAPPAGDYQRYELQRWLNFISTELHKMMGALFNPVLAEKAGDFFRDRLKQRLDWLVNTPHGDFLLGDHFTVADGYLFTVLNWGQFVDFDLSAWPQLQNYMARVGQLPFVQQALREEGLLKD
ncbi:MAG: glutathione transferase GstA [Gammaproteobacteria bacterium]|nr:MAG: glutathione transferase GstA [Gammaproteobacteria bacterium]